MRGGHAWPLSAQAVLQRKLRASDQGQGQGLGGQKKQRVHTTLSSTESSCTRQTGRETRLDTPARGHGHTVTLTSGDRHTQGVRQTDRKVPGREPGETRDTRASRPRRGDRRWPTAAPRWQSTRGPGPRSAPGGLRGPPRPRPHSRGTRAHSCAWQELPPRPTCEPPARGMMQVSRFPITFSRPTFRPSTWMV